MKVESTSKSLIVLILGLLMTVTPFAIDMYLTSFLQIAKDLGTTPSQLPLTVTGYFVGLALGQLFYGPLLDRYGRKGPLYFGLLVYVLGCLGCIESPNLGVLIAFRFVQALGGCVAGVAAVAMVRDFFPVEETAKILSKLFLILGVSPLLAPTLGGFIAATGGWQAIFIVLIILVLLIASLVFFFLPEGSKPDRSVSLKPIALARSFLTILKHPVFTPYALSGALSFTSLLLFVGGSPILFMGVFQMSPQDYGAVFALLAGGFIGSNQLNILLLRWFTSEQLMRWALTGQVAVSAVFLVGACFGWYGLPLTIAFFFLCLSCLGLVNPNASALALVPFSTKAGSASALLGFLQIGLSAAATSTLALFNLTNSVPVVAIMTATSGLALVILLGSKRELALRNLAPSEGTS